MVKQRTERGSIPGGGVGVRNDLVFKTSSSSGHPALASRSMSLRLASEQPQPPPTRPRKRYWVQYSKGVSRKEAVCIGPAREGSATSHQTGDFCRSLSIISSLCCAPPLAPSRGPRCPVSSRPEPIKKDSAETRPPASDFLCSAARQPQSRPSRSRARPAPIPAQRLGCRRRRRRIPEAQKPRRRDQPWR